MNTVKQDTHLTLRILKKIEEHHADDPITGDTLALVFGVSLRKVTQTVELLRDEGYRIGASKVKPFGYFMARSIEEILPTINTRKDQALRILTGNKKMLEDKGGQMNIYEGANETNIETEIAGYTNQ